MNNEELNLDLGYGEEESIRRDNTRLYTFIGASALLGPHDVYDHIMLADEDEDGEIDTVAYVFKDHEAYDTIVQHIRKHNFEQHLNLPQPFPIDVIAFEATHGITESELFIPEDWEASDGAAE